MIISTWSCAIMHINSLYYSQLYHLTENLKNTEMLTQRDSQSTCHCILNRNEKLLDGSKGLSICTFSLFLCCFFNNSW